MLSNISSYSFSFFNLRNSDNILFSFHFFKVSLSKFFLLLDSSIFILKQSLKTLLIYKAPMSHTKFSKEQLFAKIYTINFNFLVMLKYSFTFDNLVESNYFLKSIIGLFVSPFSLFNYLKIKFFIIFNDFFEYLLY